MWFQEWTPKSYAFRCDWSVGSEYGSHSRLNGQRNWGDLYENLMSMKIFTLIINNIFIWALKKMRKVTTASIWIR